MVSEFGEKIGIRLSEIAKKVGLGHPRSKPGADEGSEKVGATTRTYLRG
jgi:hypothetical protein